MSKYIALISLFALRIIYNPSHTAAMSQPGFAQTPGFGTTLVHNTRLIQFYEKVGNQKSRYRIKIVSKDKKAEYSPVVEIGPGA